MSDLYAVSRAWPSVAPGGHDVAVVALRGEFDMAAREELLRELLAAVADPAVRTVTVDLAEATFMDSEAIEAVLDGYTAAWRAGKPYRLANSSGIVRRVLTVTGVLDLPAGGPEGSDGHP